jgi:predicted RNA-binding protein with EMAP domain
MNTKKTVFSRMAKGMPKKQVKLSIVQDLITELDSLEDSYQNAEYLAYHWGDRIMDAFSDFRIKYNIDDFIVNGSATMLEEYANDYRAKLEELEQKANDLGLEPSDIFDRYEDAKYFVDNASDMYRGMINKYREIISYISIPDLS